MTGEVTPRSPRERELLRQIARRGLTVKYVGDNGAVRVSGHGVEVVAASLGWLDLTDLPTRVNQNHQ